jgi:DNA repair exonuclease SbcCD ATPase subunit
MIRTLGDELHEENAQAKYMRDNGHVCKVCGTQHLGVIAGYCEDHQVQRAEAAEARADELAAQIVEYERDAQESIKYQLSEIAKSRIERDELARANATLEAEVKRLHGQLHTCVSDGMKLAVELYEAGNEIDKLQREIAYLRSTDHAADMAFERTAHIDWRPSEYDSETPLVHMIEESGEVDG